MPSSMAENGRKTRRMGAGHASRSCSSSRSYSTARLGSATTNRGTTAPSSARARRSADALAGGWPRSTTHRSAGAPTAASRSGGRRRVAHPSRSSASFMDAPGPSPPRISARRSAGPSPIGSIPSQARYPHIGVGSRRRSGYTVGGRNTPVYESRSHTPGRRIHATPREVKGRRREAGRWHLECPHGDGSARRSRGWLTAPETTAVLSEDPTLFSAE
jgi:hypothetical protein